jgi:hypothetical protein
MTYQLSVADEAAYLHVLATAAPKSPRLPRWARVVPPPHQSRRALARAGVMWSPEVQRRATARPWLPPTVRRQLEADLAGAKEFGALNRAANGQRTPWPRFARRLMGAGPWPRLRRRAEKARAARV